MGWAGIGLMLSPVVEERMGIVPSQEEQEELDRKLRLKIHTVDKEDWMRSQMASDYLPCFMDFWWKILLVDDTIKWIQMTLLLSGNWRLVPSLYADTMGIILHWLDFHLNGPMLHIYWVPDETACQIPFQSTTTRASPAGSWDAWRYGDPWLRNICGSRLMCFWPFVYHKRIALRHQTGIRAGWKLKHMSYIGCQPSTDPEHLQGDCMKFEMAPKMQFSCMKLLSCTACLETGPVRQIKVDVAMMVRQWRGRLIR